MINHAFSINHLAKPSPPALEPSGMSDFNHPPKPRAPLHHPTLEEFFEYHGLNDPPAPTRAKRPRRQRRNTDDLEAVNLDAVTLDATTDTPQPHATADNTLDTAVTPVRPTPVPLEAWIAMPTVVAPPAATPPPNAPACNATRPSPLATRSANRTGRARANASNPVNATTLEMPGTSARARTSTCRKLSHSAALQNTTLRQTMLQHTGMWHRAPLPTVLQHPALQYKAQLGVAPASSASRCTTRASITPPSAC